MKIKDQIKKMLHRLGQIEVLPASVINSVKIVENHDPMVDLKDEADFFFNDELQKVQHVYLRQSVRDKLKSVNLPQGYYFKIMSAYRSLDEQKERWNIKCKELREKYPDISEEELTIKVKALCADPRKGFGGHQTGGAVDITLCDENGNDYDMGTAYRDASPKIRTNSTDINAKQAQNRKILIEALDKLDFANYPFEWWHHSYGDRLWAAYRHHSHCIYGMPEEDEFANIRQAEKNDIEISFSVPQEAQKNTNAYQGELVLNELKGQDTRRLAEIACDMAWNDTLKLLLKTDAEKISYEQFLQAKAPDLLPRWQEIMQHRPQIIHEAEKVLGKPFTTMDNEDKSKLYRKIDKQIIPLQDWHINFSQLAPDMQKSYENPLEAFYKPAQDYIGGAAKRRMGNNDGIREGFWLAIRDKESNKLLGVMAISTRILQGNLIGHSARFISPDYQRQKIAGTAGFVALDFMYKYLADFERPELYGGKEKPLFATTCHPFNSASRGLQGHNGAKFAMYDDKNHKFKYTTEREQHEQKIAQAQPIAWKAVYKEKEISSQTGIQHEITVQEKKMQNEKIVFLTRKILTKNEK